MCLGFVFMGYKFFLNQIVVSEVSINCYRTIFDLFGHASIIFEWQFLLQIWEYKLHAHWSLYAFSLNCFIIF